MDSTHYEMRGRVIAQAYWDEMEKVALFKKEVLQNAAPEALSDAWQYAAHAPAKSGLSWWNPFWTRKGKAYLAERSRANAVKGEVQSELRKREHAALDVLGNPGASAEDLEKARASRAAVEQARGRVGWLKKEPMGPDLESVNRSLAGGPSVNEQESGRRFRRNLALGSAGALAVGAGAYGYNKMNQPAVPDYPQY